MKGKNNASQPIASRQNPRFKGWVQLLEAKGIKASGLCVASGEKLIHEILRDRRDAAVEFILPPKSRAPDEEIPFVSLTGELFQELDVIGTRSPLLICRVPEIPPWQMAAPRGLEVVAALSDPSNLGALLRSCDAFGARQVILTKESSSPFLPRALRASAGSAFRIPLVRGPALKEMNLQSAVGLDLHGADLRTFEFPKNMHLVLGEEGQGLPSKLSITRVKIPMEPGIESLNATVAASISLFGYYRQHS